MERRKITPDSFMREPFCGSFDFSRDKNGVLFSSHETSHFLHARDRERLTFDSSNNKVLLNMLWDGSLQSVSFFRSTYHVDIAPGVWVQCDHSTVNNMYFSLAPEEGDFVPCKAGEVFRTGYLRTGIPVSDFTVEGMPCRVSAYAPMTKEGQVPRAGICVLLLRNDSDTVRRGRVRMPDPTNADPAYANFPDCSRRDIWVTVMDDSADDFTREKAFVLEPGETKLFACAFTEIDAEEVLQELKSRTALEWFEETAETLRDVTGDLTMPEDPLLADMLKYSILQCRQSPVMDGKGNVTQAMMGTYPPGGGINMKDMYYSFLPMTMFSPELARKSIRWFAKYGVKPRGNRYKGGISHSLGNSLSCILLSGMYYRYNADSAFFLEHPELKGTFEGLLDAVFESREEEDVYLFPSLYISDGYAMFDWHTGSNVCAWFAFVTGARLLEEVYGDLEKAEKYREIAKKVREDILTRCAGEGPNGFQFNEGFMKDGTVPFWLHDGEDTDVTLAPFYGLLSFDNEAYTRFAQFALSENNPPYSPRTRGIIWEKYPKGWKTVGPHMSDATSPGYITALAGSDSKEWLDEHMGELKKLYDLNGSLPWWPYTANSSYGEVERHYGMHCGWAMSSFICLYVSQFMGIEYDAPTRKLHVRDTFLSPAYSWKGVRLGNARFDIEKTREQGEAVIRVRNCGTEAVAFTAEFVGGKKESVKMPGGKQAVLAEGLFMKEKTVSAEMTLAAGEELEVCISIRGEMQ